MACKKKQNKNTKVHALVAIWGKKKEKQRALCPQSSYLLLINAM